MGGVDDRPGRANRPFVFYDVIYGGYGGRSHKDGAEALCPVFNASNIPVEVHESQAPVRVRRLEFLPTRRAPAGSGAAAGSARTWSSSRAGPRYRSPATGTAMPRPASREGFRGRAARPC